MNYSALAGNVVAIIRDAGQEISISHVVPSEGWEKSWDPVTDTPYWVDSEGVTTTTDPATLSTRSGYAVEVKNRNTPGQSLEVKRYRTWLSTITPDIGDEITTAAGQTFTVVAVNTVQPGGVTLYAEVQVE
jgi:hypothetical protein